MKISAFITNVVKILKSIESFMKKRLEWWFKTLSTVCGFIYKKLFNI